MNRPTHEAPPTGLAPWLNRYGILTCLILAGTFLADIRVRLGYAVWGPYLLAVVAAGQWRGAPAVRLTALLAIALLLLDIPLSPPGSQEVPGLFNRGIGVGVLVLGGWLVGRQVKAARRAQRKEEALQAATADREKAQTLLRQTQERMYLALESAGVGTWTWELGADQILWDDHVYPLYGLEPGTFAGGYAEVRRYIHPDDLPRIDETTRRVVETGTEIADSFRVVWPDGSVHVLAVRGRVRREAGRPVRLMGVLWDITEEARAKDELAVSAAKLKRSNADLEEFASVASHDLQAPLRAVTSYLELFQEEYGDAFDDQGRAWMGAVVNAAARMKQLIRDLLEFSRVGTRGVPFARVACDEVLATALEDLGAEIREAGAEVTRGPLPEVWGDRTQLTQVFTNLLGNALKYRGPTPPRVQVEARPCEAAGPRHWRVSVRDNGIGIEPRFAERIFVIFQRLHTRQEYPGTGIGLALCRRVIERHGGSIGVESSPGEGSTFSFTLRDHREPPPEADGLRT